MTSTIHNFGAGPAHLPEPVVEATAEAVRNFAGTGLSLMEIGHRTPEFTAVLEEAQSLMRELLHIPDEFSVLFLGGGARMQFCMVPMNLLRRQAAYLDSGHWAHQAMEEARLFGETVSVASSATDNYSHIPHNFTVPPTADYLHITTNNTIYGTELHSDPPSPVPLVADMTSDILTRRIDFSGYDLIYGGAQKNLSMAGVTFVIVRRSALGNTGRAIPAMLNYQTHVAHHSLYNTPPVLPIFTAREMLRWIKRQGGVDEMHRRAIERSSLIYAEIDRNPLFRGTAAKADRSLMNMCFVMNSPYRHLEAQFLDFASQRGTYAIKGHRSVGGFRASCYNGLPLASAQALVACMQDFEREVLGD